MTDRNGFENPYAHVLKTGDESWVYPSLSEGKLSVRVQWLTFQGPEYQVDFDTTHERDDAARKLFDAFAPVSERAIHGRDKYEIAREAGHDPGSDEYYSAVRDIEERQRDTRKGKFTTRDRTLTPADFAEVLGPDARFSITATSLQAREQFARLGIATGYKEGLAMTGAEVLAALEAAAPSAPGM